MFIIRFEANTSHNFKNQINNVYTHNWKIRLTMALKAMMFTINGTPFFTHVLDPKFNLNIELTSGLLSAIEMFADNAYGDIVQSINMGNNKINTLRVFLK